MPSRYVRVPALSLALLAVLSCTSDRRGDTPDPGRFHWPMGLAVDPGGDYVYVVSTNFDAAQTGSVVVPVSLETHEVLGDSAVEVGSFAGEIAIAGKDGVGVAGYVAIREDDLLEHFTIDRSSGVPVLRCGEEPEEGELARCDTVHALEPIGQPEDLVGLHTDPFALALGSDPVDGSRWLYSGSIADGTFAVMALGKDLAPNPGHAVRLDVGLHSVVEGAVVDDRRRVYVSNRFVNALHVVEVWSENGIPNIRVLDTLQVAQVAATGDYFRGIALSNDGRTLYGAFRSPSGLVVVDLDDSGKATLRGIVPLGQSPAGVAVTAATEPGMERVYVTDYMGDAVYCVDPFSMSVTDRIFVDSGPYSIAILPHPTLKTQRAYVVSFEDGKLDVIDLDPASDTWHQVIARIPEEEDEE